MRTVTPPLRGRASGSATLRRLPLVAALLVLTPVLAFAQGSATPAPAAPEAPAATTAAAVVPAGTVSSYTEEQAARGKTAYTKNCSDCHGTTLGGSGETPALAGKGFRERWFIGSPFPFFDYMHTRMPQQAPASLDLQTYADIGAYLMSRNRVPAGATELPSDAESLKNIVLPPLEN